MADEQSDKMLKVLEEIRDLLKERGEDSKRLLRRNEEGAERLSQHRADVLAESRRLRWWLVFLLALLLVWSITSSHFSKSRYQTSQVEQSPTSH